MCQKRHEIFITNLKESDVIEHDLLLVKGFIHRKCSISGIRVTAGCVNAPKEFEVSASGAFRAIWLLREGENRLNFSYCSKNLAFRLIHRKSESPYRIQPLYIVCRNHDGRFTSVSKQNSAEDGCRIISLGLKLVQCLYAEKLFEATSDRKTFSLQSDCVQFNAKLDVKRARELDEHALWNELAYEIINSELGANERLKFVAFIGCTLYEVTNITDGDYSYANIRKHTKAHAALGGGGLALFGSAGLYTWPTSVDEIVPCFKSVTEIDQRYLWDESNYRHTFGGCFATTLGAVCHEIGHIFDLGHTKDGIMGNGFDYVNRVFTVNTLIDILPDRQVETGLLSSKQQKDKRLTQLKKPSKFLEKYHEQKSYDGTFFTRSCTLILYHHKWLNHYQPDTTSSIRLDRSSYSISSDSAALAVVEVREKSTGLVTEFLDLSQRGVKEIRLKTDVDYLAFDVFAITADGSARLFN